MFADLLREIVGNPFRQVCGLSWAYLSAEGFRMLGMAMRIYDECDFGLMPVLADALEDAGCTDTAILSHCRGPGPHVRGCWVLDLLLGKE